eukprot:11819535-Alexandrium_andersonii.AAC.1
MLVQILGTIMRNDSGPKVCREGGCAYFYHVHPTETLLDLHMSPEERARVIPENEPDPARGIARTV